MSYLPVGTTVNLCMSRSHGIAWCVDVLPANVKMHVGKMLCYMSPDSDLLQTNKYGLSARVDRMVFRRPNGSYVIIPDSSSGWRCIEVLKERK